MDEMMIKTNETARSALPFFFYFWDADDERGGERCNFSGRLYHPGSDDPNQKRKVGFLFPK